MSKNSEIPLPGIGDFYGKYGTHDSTGAPFVFGKLKNANISFGASSDELRAGGGLMPLSTAVTEKSITVSATEGLVRMATIHLTQGKVDLAAGELVKRYKPLQAFVVPSVATYEIAFPTGYIEKEHVVIEYADGSGTFVKGVTPTAAGVFQEDEANDVWIFHADDAGKSIMISYLFEYDYDTNADTDGVTATVLDSRQKACPFLLHYAHIFEECGDTRVLELMLYKVRPSGTYTLPIEQGGHASPDVEFTALDPGRRDHRVGILLIQRIDA